MEPMVQQHLMSLRKTLEEVVAPALGDNAFAAEQAGLIAASLALLAEVQPHEDDLLRQEYADLAAARVPLGLPPAPPPPDHRVALADAVHALKQDQHEALLRITDVHGGELPADLRATLAHWIDRQLLRESAWSRLTGFNPAGTQVPAIAEVLATQRETP
mgnify:CR=1 FL=1|jgi:hypothetical protein